MARSGLAPLACVLLSAGAAAPAMSQDPARNGSTVSTASGSVLGTQGARGWIVRRGTHIRRPAIVGEFLYPGDTVAVQGQDAVVEVLVRGDRVPTMVREGNSPFLVPQRQATAGPAGGFWGFVESVSWPWATRNYLERTPTVARGDGGVEPDRVVDASTRLSRSASLASREQWIPRGLGSVTIAWCGDAAYGEAYRARGWPAPVG